MTTRPKPNIRRWDFKSRKAPRQGKDPVGAWALFVAAFGKSLAVTAPRAVSLCLEGVEAETFGALSVSLTGPRGVVVFRSQTLRCPGLIVFSQRAADLLTNVLHGGVAGHARRGDAGLSGVGASLLKRVAQLGLDELECGLFPGSEALGLKLTRQEAALDAAAILKDDEPTVRARLRVEDGAVSGTIDIVFPASALALFVDAHRDELQPDPLLTPAHLNQAVAEIVAELGSVELSLRELLALAPGDEVLLAQSEFDGLTVFVEGRPKLIGHAEVRRGRRTVRIA